MAESLVHIASGVCETMTLADLHVAEGDIIECLDADLSCVTPQMILEDLVDIVPSLADVAYTRYRWEYIVDLVWDTMISFITGASSVLRGYVQRPLSMHVPVSQKKTTVTKYCVGPLTVRAYRS
ncbi:hypothetical protein DL93DRAFT_2075114 [Clavulina sp. PMI_390]|nr:hypothetical protein DL93DRAFT_2075114 [Clavulina sp. PMI_390]